MERILHLEREGLLCYFLLLFSCFICCYWLIIILPASCLSLAVYFPYFSFSYLVSWQGNSQWTANHMLFTVVDRCHIPSVAQAKWERRTWHRAGLRSLCLFPYHPHPISVSSVGRPRGTDQRRWGYGGTRRDDKTKVGLDSDPYGSEDSLRATKAVAERRPKG